MSSAKSGKTVSGKVSERPVPERTVRFDSRSLGDALGTLCSVPASRVRTEYGEHCECVFDGETVLFRYVGDHSVRISLAHSPIGNALGEADRVFMMPIRKVMAVVKNSKSDHCDITVTPSGIELRSGNAKANLPAPLPDDYGFDCDQIRKIRAGAHCSVRVDVRCLSNALAACRPGDNESYKDFDVQCLLMKYTGQSLEVVSAGSTKFILTHVAAELLSSEDTVLSEGVTAEHKLTLHSGSVTVLQRVLSKMEGSCEILFSESYVSVSCNGTLIEMPTTLAKMVPYSQVYKRKHEIVELMAVASEPLRSAVEVLVPLIAAKEGDVGVFLKTDSESMESVLSLRSKAGEVDVISSVSSDFNVCFDLMKFRTLLSVFGKEDIVKISRLGGGMIFLTSDSSPIVCVFAVIED